jgi:hypothetical protein
MLSKQDNMSKFKLHLQPHGVVICKDIGKQAAGGIVHTVIRAEQPLLRCAFSYVGCRYVLEACIVVNLHHCHGAGSSCLFVQKAVYYILTEHDNNPSKVLLLLADINFR